MVGDPDGARDGDALGACVGLLDGLPDGDDVGLAVRLNRTKSSGGGGRSGPSAAAKRAAEAVQRFGLLKSSMTSISKLIPGSPGGNHHVLPNLFELFCDVV